MQHAVLFVHGQTRQLLEAGTCAQRLVQHGRNRRPARHGLAVVEAHQSLHQPVGGQKRGDHGSRHVDGRLPANDGHADRPPGHRLDAVGEKRRTLLQQLGVVVFRTARRSTVDQHHVGLFQRPAQCRPQRGAVVRHDAVFHHLRTPLLEVRAQHERVGLHVLAAFGNRAHRNQFVASGHIGYPQPFAHGNLRPAARRQNGNGLGAKLGPFLIQQLALPHGRPGALDGVALPERKVGRKRQAALVVVAHVFGRYDGVELVGEVVAGVGLGELHAANPCGRVGEPSCEVGRTHGYAIERRHAMTGQVIARMAVLREHAPARPRHRDLLGTRLELPARRKRLNGLGARERGFCVEFHGLSSYPPP